MEDKLKNIIQSKHNVDLSNIPQNPYEKLLENKIEVDEYIIDNQKYYISRDKIVYKCLDDKLGLFFEFLNFMAKMAVKQILQKKLPKLH